MDATRDPRINPDLMDWEIEDMKNNLDQLMTAPDYWSSKTFQEWAASISNDLWGDGLK